MEVATIPRRMAARVVDAVPYVVIGVVFLVVQWDEIVEALQDDTEPDLSVGWPWRFGWLLPFLYEVAFVRWLGGTFGKLVLGVSVVDLDGGRPTWASAAQRAFVFHLVPFAVLGMVVRSDLLGAASQVGQLVLLVSIVGPDDQRGWHDRASGTRVVRKPRAADRRHVGT